jgi:hypothetical protein
MNHRGQILIESVLMMVVLLGLLFTGTRMLRDNEVIAKLISGPWILIAGMVENGQWKPVAQARANHPNSIGRHYSQKENH